MTAMKATASETLQRRKAERRK
jgi:hypothetical protein